MSFYRRKFHIFMITALCLYMLGGSALNALAYQAKVIKVSDGDTLTVLKNNGQQVKVRLYGIDCPESGQDYGHAATRFTSQAVINKNVEVQVINTDQYGRAVAVIKYGDTSLNAELVRSGYAWYYAQYCKTKDFCRQLEHLEQTARAQNIGLWQAANPVAPWNYRKGHTEEENVLQKAERLTKDASKLLKALKGLWREVKSLVKIITNE